MRLLRPIHPLLALRGGEPGRDADARPGASSPIVAVLIACVVGAPGAPRSRLVLACCSPSLVGAWLLTFFSNVLLGTLAFYIESAHGRVRALARRCTSSSPVT